MIIDDEVRKFFVTNTKVSTSFTIQNFVDIKVSHYHITNFSNIFIYYFKTKSLSLSVLCSV